MIDVLRVSKQSEEILEIVNTIFGERGITLPERQYVAIGGLGSAAHDCEQVTVSFGELVNRLAGSQLPVFNNCPTFYTGLFVIEIVRCVPTGNGAQRKGQQYKPPSAADLNSYAASRMQDVAVLDEVAKAIIEEFSITKGIEYSISFSEPSDMQGVSLSIELTV